MADRGDASSIVAGGVLKSSSASGEVYEGGQLLPLSDRLAERLVLPPSEGGGGGAGRGSLTIVFFFILMAGLRLEYRFKDL